MRISSILVSVATLSVMSGTAIAGSLEDILASLASEGFAVTEVDKTMLGNVKIEANKGNVEREVVYSPLLDTVLRDTTDTEGESGGKSDDDRNGGIAGNDDDTDDDADEDHSEDSNDDSGDDGGSDDGGDDGGDDDGGDDGNDD